MTPRQRGDYFEHQTRDALRAHDWFVIRAAGSLGIADLVALRDGKTPLLVSCKLDGRVSPAERQKLAATAQAAGARAILASRRKPGWVTLWAVKLDQMPVDLNEELKVPTRRRAEEASDDDDIAEVET